MIPEGLCVRVSRDRRFTKGTPVPDFLEWPGTLAWGGRVLLVTPTTDIQRIKGEYEDAYKQVTSIRRIGTRWLWLNQARERRYEVIVRREVSGDVRYVVEVEATMYRSPRLNQV